jgi:hypothetical protein
MYSHHFRFQIGEIIFQSAIHNLQSEIRVGPDEASEGIYPVKGKENLGWARQALY